MFKRILSLVAAFLCFMQAASAQVGIFDLPSAGTLSAPVSNKTVVFDQSLKQWVYYNGSAWVNVASPAGNYSATTAPGVTDDSAAGWSIGSVWIDTVTDVTYVCVSNAVGAAVWTALDKSTGISLPSIFTGSGSLVDGSYAIALASQSANQVFLSPSGGAGAPSFGSLTNSYLPIVDMLHGGTGSALSSVPGGLAYCTSGGVVAFNVPGTAGQALLSNGGGIPAFGTLGLTYGGSGTNLSALTDGSILFKNGSIIDSMAPGASGTAPVWNGSTWAPATVPGASSFPAYQLYGNMTSSSAVPVASALVTQALPQNVVTFGGNAGTTSIRPIIKTPAAPTVTPTGTTGAATWTYKIVALDVTGTDISAASPAGTTSTGNATLNSTNYNALSWTAATGAYQYKIYRTASGGTPSTTGLIATVTSTTYNDQGAAGDSSVPQTFTTLTGEHWQIGDWSTTTSHTCNRCRLHVTGNVTISNPITVATEMSGGQIQGNGSGLGAGSSFGPTYNGTTNLIAGGGGGGHGGAGGNGARTSSGQGGGGGGTYNIEHFLPGSGGAGGGASTADTGGAGGGAFYLEATGNVTIGADITANGGNGGGSSANAGGGGGSGGTIDILANGNITINAGINFNAIGGTGGSPSGGIAGGGGGGGIVIVHCAGTMSNSGNVPSVGGGAAGTGGVGASNGGTGSSDIRGGVPVFVRMAP